MYSLRLPIAYEGEGRDRYRDQVVTCDVGVSLNSKTHSQFMKYSNGTSTQCCAYQYARLFPVLFLQSRIFSFIYTVLCDYIARAGARQEVTLRWKCVIGRRT